jgi:hypothetical protein
MEGSTEAVKKQNCGGGCSYHPLAILLWNAFTICLAISPCAFAQTFDVLIVEKPDHLVIYDSFQQSLSSLNESVLQPFAPFKVLKQRDVLSDGLTACEKVEVDGEVFYLLRDESGQLAGRKALGTVRNLQNAKLLNDTIEVLGPRSIVLQHPVKSGRRFLSNGDRCLRYFNAAGVVYARLLGAKPEYGWLRLPATEKGRSWQKVRAQPMRLDLSPMIRDRVNGRIKDVNGAFSQVYSLLNKETGKRYPVPQWEVESTNTSLICVLRPAAAAGFYKQSIQTLSATLQTYLLGTGYDVREHGNRIEIRRR